MATIQEVIADALRDLFIFMGATVRWVLGLLSAAFVGALPAVAEVQDDLANFDKDPLYWQHISKVLLAGVIPAIGLYIKGHDMYQKALMTPPPEVK